MKAAEWTYFDMAAQEIPFFTGSVSEAEKAQERNYWKGLARQWWAQADAYEEEILEAAWDAQERAFYAEWEAEASRAEDEEEAAYSCLLRAGEEILTHLRGQDTVLWDKEDGEEVKSASVSIPAPVKARGRALRRQNNAAHRGKNERGESPFFQTAWLKHQAAKGVRRSTSVPSRGGGFKKAVSFYAL